MPTKKLRNELDALNDTIEYLIDVHSIDSLAFCGSSGSAAAFYLAIKHQLGLIYVRKNNEQSHGRAVEVNQRSHRYAIVDDLVASGSTIAHIISNIDDYTNHRIKCVGVVVYDNNYYGDKVQSSVQVDVLGGMTIDVPMYWRDTNYTRFKLTESHRRQLDAAPLHMQPRWYQRMMQTHAALLAEKMIHARQRANVYLQHHQSLDADLLKKYTSQLREDFAQLKVSLTVAELEKIYPRDLIPDLYESEDQSSTEETA